MSNRITCRTHDQLERVIAVGVENEGTLPMLTVWNRITIYSEKFHTLENGRRANVLAKERSGSKYLTTAADGHSNNNLDELRNCN